MAGLIIWRRHNSRYPISLDRWDGEGSDVGGVGRMRPVALAHVVIRVTLSDSLQATPMAQSQGREKSI